MCSLGAQWPPVHNPGPEPGPPIGQTPALRLGVTVRASGTHGGPHRAAGPDPGGARGAPEREDSKVAPSLEDSGGIRSVRLGKIMPMQWKSRSLLGSQWPGPRHGELDSEKQCHWQWAPSVFASP